MPAFAGMTAQGLWGRILSKIPLRLQKYMLDSELIVLDANDLEVKKAIKDKLVQSRGFLNLFSKSAVLRANAEELKKDLSLFDNWSGDKEDLSLGLGNYLWATVPGMTEKLWRELEQYSLEKGIFSKGGYMNTREYIKEEGRTEGLMEGRQEVVSNMLKEKADVAFISKVTGLSVKEIKKLKNGF